MSYTTIEEFGRHVNGFMKSNLTYEQQISNWSMGLAGETGELLELCLDYPTLSSSVTLDTQKELGGIFWYLTALHITMGVPLIKEVDVDFTLYFKSTPLVTTSKFAVDAFFLVDYLKKVVYHDKKLDAVFVSKTLNGLFNRLCFLCWVFNIDYQSVFFANIEQLRARHEGRTVNFAIAEQNKENGVGD